MLHNQNAQWLGKEQEKGNEIWKSWFPKRGEVYLCQMGDSNSNQGSEIKGLRPVVIISNNICNKYSPVVTVTPLTSSQIKLGNDIPVHVKVGKEENLRMESITCAEQTKSVSKIKMNLFKRNKMETSVNNLDLEKTKKELAYAVRKAIGYRSTEDFSKQLKMIDPKPIINILKKEYKEFPDRKLLRKIASNSFGRITYQFLYDLCGYKESDPEEDRSWAKWVPQWGEVYMCDLGIGEDCLQGGQRPVIVIQNNKGNQYSPNVSILPVSSKSKFNNSFLHILLEKELGFEKNSYCMAEMPLTISKRRFFYNIIPYKITTLSQSKMKEIQFALEKQLGFQPLMFNENEAFNIKILQNNIRVKQSHNLVDLLEEKLNELIEYCSKYHKNYKYIMQEYDRINNYAYQVV